MDLETRIRRLESQNRWMRLGLTALVITSFGYVSLGALVPDVVPQIRCRELYIEDQEGHTRMALLSSHLDGPYFIMETPDKKSRISMSLMKRRAFIELVANGARTGLSTSIEDEEKPVGNPKPTQ